MFLQRTLLMLMAFAAALPVTAAAPADDAKPALTVDKQKKTVSIACKIAPRKLENLTEIYPIEVIACWPAPKGKKAHETVVTFDVKPSDIHKALESLSLTPGKPAVGEGQSAKGAEVKIYLEVPAPGGVVRRVPIEKTLVDRKTGKTLPTIKWLFTGSAMTQPDPNKDEKVYGADLTGTLIAIFPVTAETVIQTSLTMAEEPLIKMETNTKVLPPIGTDVTLVIAKP